MTPVPVVFLHDTSIWDGTEVFGKKNVLRLLDGRLCFKKKCIEILV
jgi:hypothetical protein